MIVREFALAGAFASTFARQPPWKATAPVALLLATDAGPTEGPTALLPRYGRGRDEGERFWGTSVNVARPTTNTLAAGS